MEALEVLLVESEDKEAALRAFSKPGFKAVLVGKPEDGLALIKEKCYDLAFIGINLPRENPSHYSELVKELEKRKTFWAAMASQRRGKEELTYRKLCWKPFWEEVNCSKEEPSTWAETYQALLKPFHHNPCLYEAFKEQGCYENNFLNDLREKLRGNGLKAFL